MRNRLVKTLTATAATGALAVAGLASPAGAAPAADGKLGTTSLATVLAADGHHFDHNWKDFDVLDAAVGAVLKKNPDSPVGILAQGNKRVTAFLPTDAAFRSLVTSLTGKRLHSEKRVFTTLAKAAGVKTIEQVLLYHVIVGSTITEKQARQADGAKLTTAEGATLTVVVKGKRVILRDKDRDTANGTIIAFNINKGNKQIGHAINHVLRPVNL